MTLKTTAMSADVRVAGPEDDPALVRLASLCTMDGSIGLRFDRSPTYFELCRLAGKDWVVGVVDDASGCPIGAVLAARQSIYLDGEPQDAVYIGDMKVHPEHRRSGIARDMLRWAQRRAADMVGWDGLRFSTVLRGNQPVEQGIEAHSTAIGCPMTQTANIRSYSIPLAVRRSERRLQFDVDRAVSSDFEEMQQVWDSIAPTRDGARTYGPGESLHSFVDSAPGLSPGDYLVARGRSSGRIVGFFGLWDQHDIKQMRVTSYSQTMSALRLGFNTAARMSSATPLPPTGGAMRYRSAVNVCVPGDHPAILRALVSTAHNRLLSEGYSLLIVGLDERDPLSEALSGFFAQPTDVSLMLDYVGGSRPVRRMRPTAPMHFEISTV